MTPLIDVVFQLVLFFLTATSFYKIEKDIRVEPPRATQARAAAQEPQEITVNVRKESAGGFYIVNQRILTLEQLNDLLTKAAARNPHQAVIIRGDKEAYHQRIVDVLDACEKAKISRHFIATTSETPAGR